MRKHWKKLALVLGCSMLLVGQVPVTVHAEEAAAGQGEAQTTVQKATDLKWGEGFSGTFTNPNDFPVQVKVYCKNTTTNTVNNGSFGVYGPGEQTVDVYHLLSGTGDYYFKIVLGTEDGNNWADISDPSAEKRYTWPGEDTRFPMPGFTVDEKGVVTCDLSAFSAYTLGQDYGINYLMIEYDKSGRPTGRRVQRGTNEGTFDFSSAMTEGNIYKFQVQALSRNVENYLDSDMSPEVALGGSFAGGPSGGGSSNNNSNSGSSSGDGCSHNYEWEIVTEATDTQDGREAYKCTRCGHVKAHMEVANSAYAQFNKNAISSIDRAPLNGTVTLKTNMWVSFYDDVIETLKGRPDVTVVVNYFYEGTHYSMTIPAGADLSALTASEGYYGFRYLNTFFPGKAE